MGTGLVPIGQLPPRGVVPDTMLAQVVRQDIPRAHQEMGDGVNVFGNRIALVGAATAGLGAFRTSG